MKVTTQILSIPPYISTSWKNISSLHVEAQGAIFTLVILLSTGTRIEIPHLDALSIEQIFNTHAKYLEQEEVTAKPKTLPTSPYQFLTGSYIDKLPGGTSAMHLGREGLQPLIGHNPDQADNPDLPPEMLKKLASLAKMVGIEDPEALPKAEKDCNCFHCQISNALHAGFNETKDPLPEIEEIVTDEELTFRSWDITKTGEDLYLVTHPLDTTEQYTVYLGSPVGCTCGEKHCAHMVAVLSS